MAKKKKATVKEFNAIFQEEKRGGFSVWIPDLPGCVSQGETFEEAKKNIAEAIELYKVLKRGTLRKGILKVIPLSIDEFAKLLKE